MILAALVDAALIVGLVTFLWCVLKPPRKRVRLDDILSEVFDEPPSTQDDYAVGLRALLTLCPALSTCSVSCPACASEPLLLHRAIRHLNEDHGWGMERVALWLDSLPYDLALNNPSSSGD